jgi:hypothetical protein
MRVATLLLLAVLAAAAAMPAFACPFCKDAVGDGTAASSNMTSGGTQQGAARGYAFAIYLMLAVPFAMVAGGVFVVVRSVRRAQGQAMRVARPIRVAPTLPSISEPTRW